MKKNTKLFVSLLCAGIGAASLAVASNVNAVEASAENAIAIEMQTGASIRYGDNSGIRFTTSYKADFTALDISGYSFGTLVYPANLLAEGEALTHETENAVDVQQLVWRSESDSELVMNSVITDIPEATAAEQTASYGRVLTARSYYKTPDGTYVYSDTVVERGIAQTASLLLSQGKGTGYETELNAYVDAVASNVTVSLSETSVEMVAGGKKTITVTTSPENYGVTWASENEQVATVSGGVITAVAIGETKVNAYLGGSLKGTVTVKVSEYIGKDGSEIVYTTTDGTVGDYSMTSEVVGGRTGVYKYSTTTTEWTDKLNVKVGGHLNSDDGVARVKSLREFKNAGYNYVTFDIYLASGAQVRLSSLINADDYAVGSNTALADKLVAGAAITEANSNISIYKLGNKVTTTAAGVWYTVLVDYSEIDVDVYAAKAGVYSRIEIGGIYGTIYLDNVRYYGSNSVMSYVNQKYEQHDGSEFVTAKPWSDDTATYGLYEGTVAGRTGVYKWSSTVSNWNDKISIKQTHHLSNGTPTYASSSAAATNMKNNGYAYVAFDVCMESGAMIINVPDIAAAGTTSLQKYDKVWVGSEITKGSDLIKYYQVGADGTYTEVTKLLANTWYTVVVAYDWTPEHTSASYAGIDLGSWSKANVYLDNVRYYGANPVA